MSTEEFVDKPRNTQAKYHDLLDRMNSMKRESVLKALKRLIKEDPDFLEPYLILSELYLESGYIDKADKMVDDAYQRALDLITDEQGNWPQNLRWGFMENRHIIRALVQKGVTLWEQKHSDEALQLFRKLLEVNPEDNIGARYYILALRMEFSFVKFDGRFNKEGFYDSDLFNWFEKHAPKYKDEFDWWFEKMKEWGI